MSAYWVAHVNIHNHQQYQKYIELAPEAFKKYRGRFIARGEKATTLEGETFITHVIIEFPDYKSALECYKSIEYQQAKKERIEVANAMITIIDGL